MHIRRRSIAALLLGTASFVIAAPAFAQTASEDQAQAANQTDASQDDDSGPQTIIVTATKRASTVQDVPFSINAQTQEDIQRANASTIEDISRNVAGLDGPEPRAGAEPGVDPRRVGRADRPRPAGRQGTGRRLPRRIGRSRCRCSRPISTCSTSIASKRCAARRAPCSARAASAARCATSPTSPSSGRTEGLVEANINTVDESDVGGHVKGAINVPLGQTAALRVVGYDQKFAGFIDADGPGGRARTSTTAAASAARVLVPVGADRRRSRSPRAWSIRKCAPTASTARRCSTSSPTR